jgi:hypothetical protein
MTPPRFRISFCKVDTFTVRTSTFDFRFHCCLRRDTAGFAERHEDGFHANRLVTDVAGAARHGHQQSVYAYRYKDAIRELQRLMIDVDVAFADAGMRWIEFVDAVGIEPELGNGDTVGLAAGQSTTRPAN